MKVLVCGGRKFNNERFVVEVLNDFHKMTPIDMIISGSAPGADRLGELWAQRFGILVERYPAEWDRYGRSAGFKRNAQMINEGKPDLVVAFAGGKGTAHTVKLAKAAGIDVFECVWTSKKESYCSQ